jgi:hypothetical protein
MAIIAAVSGSSLLNAVIWIIIAGVIFWLLNWLIAYVGIPEPFQKVAKVIIAVAVVIILINALMTIAGRPFISW